LVQAAKTLGQDSQPISYAHQLCQGAGSHLLHYLMAINFDLVSLVPGSALICLLSSPATTGFITSRSREAKRLRNLAIFGFEANRFNGDMNMLDRSIRHQQTKFEINVCSFLSK